MAVQVIQKPPSTRARTMEQVGQAFGTAGQGLGQIGLQQMAGQQQLERQKQLMQEQAELQNTRLGAETTQKLLGQIFGAGELEGFEGADLTAGEVSQLTNAFTGLAEARRRSDLPPEMTSDEKRVASYLIQNNIPVTPENLLVHRISAEATERKTKAKEKVAAEVTKPKGPEELAKVSESRLRTKKGKAKNFKDITDDDKFAVEREYALADRAAVVVAKKTLGRDDAELVDIDPREFQQFAIDKGYTAPDIQSGVALAAYLIENFDATEDSAQAAIERLQRIQSDLAQQRAPLEE